MDVQNIKKLVQSIVEEACRLKDMHTEEKRASVNYACIFSQTIQEYDNLFASVKKIGTVIKETSTGPLFQIHPLDTVSGNLRLLKVRLPDSTRPERGDTDFTVSNYFGFKKKYLSQKGFKLLKRENFEMVELIDAGFNVRAYFSYPTLEEQLNLK